MGEVIKFEGQYADLLRDYVVFRQGLGFAMPASSQRTLRHMADYLYSLPSIAEVLDARRAEEFCARREHESVCTRQSRYVVVRQFCLHLNRIGIKAYIPPEGMVKGRTNFIPRIVNEEEMAHIIHVAEQESLIWPAMVLKILWCTGIRVGEAASLRVGDLHRQQHALYIAHAKNDRSRIIPIHESLAADLLEYIDRRIVAPSHDGWLFLGRDLANHHNKVAISNHLHGIYRKAGILDGNGLPIRTHDLRHSFAIKCLENMVEQGVDVYVVLPCLSAYMGHANIYDTEYYLRFLPSAYQGLLDCEGPISNVVFGGGGR